MDLQPTFSGKINFNSKAVQTLLEGNYVFAGTHCKDGNDYINVYTSIFYANGVWVNNWGLDKDKYNSHMSELEPGNIIVAKKLCNPNDKMLITAMGVIVGGSPTTVNRTFVYVAWVLPHLDFIMNREEIGTISNIKKYSEIKEPSLKSAVDKCKVRFLAHNIGPITHTLYQI